MTEPVRFSDTKTFTQHQVEAALCAWEWMLDERQGKLSDQFEKLGSAAMRHCSQQAGDIALRVHEHMRAQGYEFIGSYDWEFVPAVLERLDWEALCADNQYNSGIYDPDIAEIFVVILTADKAIETDRRFFSKEPHWWQERGQCA